MKTRRFRVSIYDFNITYIKFEGKQDVDRVAKLFKQEGLGQKDIDDTKSILLEERNDGGFTDTNFDKKKIVVVIYPSSRDEKQRNIIAHESRHVADRILEACAIDDLEAAAWLQGYLAEYIY